MVTSIVDKFAAAQTRTKARAKGGQRIVDVFVEQVKGALMSDVATGGRFGQQIAGTFGMSRQGRYPPGGRRSAQQACGSAAPIAATMDAVSELSSATDFPPYWVPLKAVFNAPFKPMLRLHR